MAEVDLSRYNNDWYSPGAPRWKQLVWFLTNALFFINPLNPLSGLKVALLRLFGAQIGEGVMIKPGVNIKYPWFLTIGNHVWIGENVWIDNLTHVTIDDHACLSQGAMLLTGSHDYKQITFDLKVSGITLRRGVWIGAKALVCPGVTAETHSVLAASSVATTDLAPYMVYQGNPAVAKRPRDVQSQILERR
ncbi:putative colanic acid biosynthesis acetyltransferase WcaF [Catalinimonas alkaloidigena]|uniref:Putative colanic acid biosynthesis acetyltransferase WcaF n=1 Tax=Catalinimonas alkaloidigena TaxID=1075417 RepID=A0A1G9LF24_9BACT|nr:putative colanic acid biosynthesis acetyltransferase [Catalinimonas alkaloidigena]SDL60540.1 putative colanic acid biosynthesis acetyltransferase WcaF [Catalinimonas alkaloidigena]